MATNMLTSFARTAAFADCVTVSPIAVSLAVGGTLWLGNNEAEPSSA